MIDDIGIIEYYSTFAKKVRTGDITAADFHLAIAEIAADLFHGTIQVAYFGESDKHAAAVLITKYGLSRNLRTLDAMHMAVMKRLSSMIRYVYCADAPFVALLREEGLPVINPEEPPQNLMLR